MAGSSKIAIVNCNSLETYALADICRRYLGVSDVILPSSADEMESSCETADILLVDSVAFVAHYAWLAKHIGQVAVFSDSVNSICYEGHFVFIPSYLDYNHIVSTLKEISTETSNTEEKTKSDLLSDREKEVLKCVCKGMINKEIADELCISLHTVITHRKNITAKLKIKSVPALTIFAVLNGIIPREDIG